MVSSTVRLTCGHCRKPIRGKNRLCTTCRELDTCTICGVIFDDRTDELGDFIYIAKRSTNSDYCTSCLKFEESIDIKCFVCEKEIEWSIERFIARGNCCESCNSDARYRVTTAASMR